MIKIGSLYCRGLRYNLKETQIATDFKTYKLDILAVQETHIKDTSVKQIKPLKGSLLNFYSSGNSHRTGVGIITDQNFRGTFTPISDRLC